MQHFQTESENRTCLDTRCSVQARAGDRGIRSRGMGGRVKAAPPRRESQGVLEKISKPWTIFGMRHIATEIVAAFFFWMERVVTGRSEGVSEAESFLRGGFGKVPLSSRELVHPAILERGISRARLLLLFAYRFGVVLGLLVTSVVFFLLWRVVG